MCVLCDLLIEEASKHRLLNSLLGWRMGDSAQFAGDGPAGDDVVATARPEVQRAHRAA